MPPTSLNILVPIEDPKNDNTIVDLASRIASPSRGELHLIHVAQNSYNNRHVILKDLSIIAKSSTLNDVRTSLHVENGEDIVTEIQDRIQQLSCNMIFMAWRAEINSISILASNNRSLTKDLNLDTLIFKERNLQKVERILVPTGGGPHSVLGIQIAHDLALNWGAEIEILRIARDLHRDPSNPLHKRYCKQLEEDTKMQLELLKISAPVRIISAEHVVPAVTDYSKNFDLVVMGASNDWRQDEYLSGSIPDKIANSVGCSALMARSASTLDAKLSKVFWEQMIRLNFRPKDKWEAIEQMIDVLIEEEQFPSEKRDMVLAAAINRERQGSTALGHQTAIPHAPITNLPGIIGCLGICPDGLDFQNPTGEKIHFIFLLLTPRQNYRSYIPLLAQIANLVRTASFRSALLASQTPAEVTHLLKSS
ncbi:MAG: PTS sugar transporter subunit IIA [Candidatus Latescibacterota bacterium]|nr:PTS sugar transporter subunit IIA [Candidatus Latescibacterota bacterium]